MKTLTYVDALNTAISALTDIPGNDEVVAKLTALRDQTAKRNSADRKPTKKQVENVALAEKVINVLRGADEPMTVTEIMKNDLELSGMSNQKVTALIRTLGDRVVKTVDKRVSKFSLAE